MVLLGVFLWYNNHACTPLCRRALRYWLNDTKSDVPVKIRLHFLFPMMGDRYGCILRYGLGIKFEAYVERPSGHSGQCLVFAKVEGT